LEVEKLRKKARNNAYSLLRSRPRSEQEIRERLKLKGYGDRIVEDVIQDLRRAGEIDDERFARIWVESRMHRNPVGDILLRQELEAKGVSDPIIESVLASKAESYDEFETAFNMARERFERLKKIDRRKAAKRVYDFLMRRGFAYESVKKIIGELNA